MRNFMNDEKENLSHLLDEYSSNDVDQASLDDLLGDVNQQYCLTRYQMIGQVMRHELPEKIDISFSQNVMQSVLKTDLENKSVVSQKSLWQKKLKPNWSWKFLKPFAGIAIASSVSIVSITLWDSVSVTTGSAVSGESIVSAEQQKIESFVNQPIQAAVPASTSLAQLNSNSNGMHWKVISDAPALERKLNAYLINHTEYSKSIQGLIPQARVAGYGTDN
jgi:negative regulator of sigma E activity